MGFFDFLTEEIAIDLGTANTLIIHNDKVVIDSPSIVARDRVSGKIIAVGKEANLMQGKTHENIKTIRPHTNSLSGIESAFQPPRRTNQLTLAPEELPELMQNLSVASIKLTTRCLIEWQLHTMVRPSEAAGTRWDEIDLENQVWTIPAERMKKRKAHAIPLSNQAIALLEIMRPICGSSKFVFPSDRNPRTHINSQTANMALKRMGYAKKLVAHGLRSLASTVLNEQGFDPDIIEAALAHTSKNEVRNAYNRAQYIERRKPMMDWWSKHIEQAATGNMSLTGTAALKLVSG